MREKRQSVKHDVGHQADPQIQNSACQKIVQTALLRVTDDLGSCRTVNNGRAQKATWQKFDLTCLRVEKNAELMKVINCLLKHTCVSNSVLLKFAEF